MPRFILVASLIISLVMLSGCNSLQTSDALTDVDEPPATSSNETTDEALDVIFKFATLVSNGDIEAAAGLLEASLWGVYSFNDYGPLRNTPTMEIVEIEEMPDWPPDSGAEDLANVEFRVFYAQVRYEVLDIHPSYFVDGEIFHHKITVIKPKGSSQWLISELSTAPI